jgi:hypothetical protein
VERTSVRDALTGQIHDVDLIEVLNIEPIHANGTEVHLEIDSF